MAANANVAAPIDAAVAANIGSIDCDATAVAQQDAIINQNIDGDATANADQTSDIDQSDQVPTEAGATEPAPADEAPADQAPPSRHRPSRPLPATPPTRVRPRSSPLRPALRSTR